MDRLVDELRVLVPNGEQLEFAAPSSQTLADAARSPENDLTHALQWYFYFACSQPGTLGVWQRRLCEARASHWRRLGDAARPAGCERQAQCERIAATYERITAPSALLRALKPCYGMFFETHAEMLHRRGATQTAVQVAVAAPPALGWLRAAVTGECLDLRCCAAQYVEWVGAMFPDARVRIVAQETLQAREPVTRDLDVLPARALGLAMLVAGGDVLKLGWHVDPSIVALVRDPSPRERAAELLTRIGFATDAQQSQWAAVSAPSLSGRYPLAMLTAEGVQRVPAADRHLYSIPTTTVVFGSAAVSALVLEVRLDAVTRQVTTGAVYLGVVDAVTFPGETAPQAALLVAPFVSDTPRALPRAPAWPSLFEGGRAWRLLLAHQLERAQAPGTPSLEALCTGAAVHAPVRDALYAAVRAQGGDTSEHPCAEVDSITRIVGAEVATSVPSPATQRRKRPRRVTQACTARRPSKKAALPHAQPRREDVTRLAQSCTYQLLTAARHRNVASDPHEQCTPLLDQVATYLSLRHE